VTFRSHLRGALHHAHRGHDHPHALSVEANGLNVIPEDQRHGRPRDLFWPWCAANISVLSVSYGAILLGRGLSFAQALVAVAVGSALSFLLVGVVSLAGQRGSAPTMVLSRAAFGIRGNALPSLVSWLLLLGWQVVGATLAVLTLETLLTLSGGMLPSSAKAIALAVICGSIMLIGVAGFDIVFRMQRWVTIASVILTIGYLFITAPLIDLGAALATPSGSVAALVGGLVLMMASLGIGWTNSAADFSRYLPRTASGRSVVAWTTLGAAFPPIVLAVYGFLLTVSSPTLAAQIADNPIGALAGLLPTWYLWPFAIVVTLGMLGSSAFDTYSSGLVLLNLGLRVPRAASAAVVGLLMTGLTFYLVFGASSFFAPFVGFIVTLGVPISAWCGIFVADLLLRHTHYDDEALYDAHGRYGSVNGQAVLILLAATFVGLGLVTNPSSPFLQWQGYLLGPLRSTEWASANLGVVLALAMSFVGYLVLCRSRVRAQEAGVGFRG